MQHSDCLVKSRVIKQGEVINLAGNEIAYLCLESIRVAIRPSV
ncbi:hypothetical protein QWZ16_22010 [Vibrio ostreicida]|uniref:Uncharacterized protein n=1 Tax=Vibrio ostreicida TaxID=526588 RepID=A0ABT8C0W9_9VIBR|nr:hypothetical protein [Vibrio ostreicida]MDN3611154.1 hypothetical protein [Vibrio ostreicida]MDN3612274.1 hypothetical protein [Vibrio ostreicida]